MFVYLKLLYLWKNKEKVIDQSAINFARKQKMQFQPAKDSMLYKPVEQPSTTV